MFRLRDLLICVLLPAWLVQPAWAQRVPPPLPPVCDASAEYLTPDNPLTRVTAALKAGQPMNILAVGSGTTVGEVNGTPGTSFPYRMVEALKLAWPDVAFSLTVRGGRMMTAEAMLPLLQEAVAARPYTLVLWQTGTVEAVRGLRPDGLRSVLRAGVDAVRDAKGDVVLIDPQFSRFLRANTDLDPYETVLRDIALTPDVALFRRFDLMRSWANEGRIDLERARKPERDVAVTTLNVCLGEMLARFVLHGALSVPR